MLTLRGGENLRLKRREGWSLSVFALGGPCRGLSLQGTLYPLDHAELSPFFPLGVSNGWTEEEAEISLEEGLLLIVLSRLDENGKND